MMIKDLEPFTFNYIPLIENLVQLEAFQCMKEKQIKFLPLLPEVPNGVPRGIPFPSAMVAYEKKFLCRTSPLGCALRESTWWLCAAL